MQQWVAFIALPLTQNTAGDTRALLLTQVVGDTPVLPLQEVRRRSPLLLLTPSPPILIHERCDGECF